MALQSLGSSLVEFDSSSLVGLTASELAAGIKNGDFTAQEVVEAHIQRIEAVNGKLNAVVVKLYDNAREQAVEADKTLQKGEATGPLHGVPITIKDQFHVAGTATTIGLTSEANRIYESDAPTVRKLREAGAIILGKTNIMQTLSGWESDNPVFGRTNNPWNVDRSPGGSSGGEAAIIASGGVPLGLGGDYGGSIRIPAHVSGICGIKPTSGRLTNEGVPFHLFDVGQQAFIAQPGPMARSVEDLYVAMDVLATGDPSEYVADPIPPVPWSAEPASNIDGLRVGIYTDNGFFPPSAAVARAVREAADTLSNNGAEIKQVKGPDAEEGMRLFLGVVTAGGGKTLKRILGKDSVHPALAGLIQGATVPKALRGIISAIMSAQGQNQLSRMLGMMGERSAQELWNLIASITYYRTAFLKSFDEQEFDVILCPPYGLPAVQHGSTQHLVPASSYAMVYNVLGAPAGVLPITTVKPGEETMREPSRDKTDLTAAEVDRGSAGLPVGVQIVAKHWREDIVLNVMNALEKLKQD